MAPQSCRLGLASFTWPGLSASEAPDPCKAGRFTPLSPGHPYRLIRRHLAHSPPILLTDHTVSPQLLDLPGVVAAFAENLIAVLAERGRRPADVAGRLL